jgi:hypothetical protein
MATEQVVLLTLGGLTVLSGVVVYAGAQVVSLDANIRTLLKQRETQENLMQSISQVVTRSDGASATITTPREKDADGVYESVESWKARHDAAVAAFQGN